MEEQEFFQEEVLEEEVLLLHELLLMVRLPERNHDFHISLTDRFGT